LLKPCAYEADSEAMRDARNALENLKSNDSVAIAARAIIENMDERAENMNDWAKKISWQINQIDIALKKLSGKSNEAEANEVPCRAGV
jgi:hypothetical protein